jgi:hypothetical protein
MLRGGGGFDAEETIFLLHLHGIIFCFDRPRWWISFLSHHAGGIFFFATAIVVNIFFCRSFCYGFFLFFLPCNLGGFLFFLFYCECLF